MGVAKIGNKYNEWSESIQSGHYEKGEALFVQSGAFL